MPEAAWPYHKTCSAKCPKGPHKCKDRSCGKTHWMKQSSISPHEAMTSSKGKGMSQVINIINGGYDCCPSSTYITRYGHSTYRMWWFLDAYSQWTGNFPYADISKIEMEECPLGNGINCGRMKGSGGSKCWSNCCSAI